MDTTTRPRPAVGTAVRVSTTRSDHFYFDGARGTVLALTERAVVVAIHSTRTEDGTPVADPTDEVEPFASTELRWEDDVVRIEVTLHCEQRATVEVEADPFASDADLTRLALERLDASGGAEWETHTAWIDRAYDATYCPACGTTTPITDRPTLRQQLEAAEAAVARVEALHHKGATREGVERCACLHRWPCPTAVALEATR